MIFFKNFMKEHEIFYEGVTNSPCQDVDADDPDGGISKELFDMFQDLSSDDGDSSADEEV